MESSSSTIVLLVILVVVTLGCIRPPTPLPPQPSPPDESGPSLPSDDIIYCKEYETGKYKFLAVQDLQDPKRYDCFSLAAPKATRELGTDKACVFINEIALYIEEENRDIACCYAYFEKPPCTGGGFLVDAKGKIISSDK